MKKHYILLIIALIGFVSKAQIVNIPDANFKAKLLAANSSNQIASSQTPNIITYNVTSYNSIDTNNDGEIQLSEALAIKWLDVESSSITNLTGIEAFTNLIFLNCYSNQLGSLDVSSLINLKNLLCSSNQLTNLNINGLSGLRKLNCSVNQLSSLALNGLTNLENLDCSANLLTSLDVHELINLTSLSCGSNLLTSLDLNLLTNLLDLYCNQNQLTTLDVSESTRLNSLYCSSNQLTSLFMKNGSDETYVNFYSNPDLQFICADNSQISNIEYIVGISGITNCHVNSYCSFTPGGVFYTIQGNNHFDADNNGCDNSDMSVPNLKYHITDTVNSDDFISDISGSYLITTGPGTHTLTPVLENPSYFNISPASVSVIFPSTPSPVVQDFCLTANGPHNDLEIAMIPIIRARPGFDAIYKIIYRNKGTQTQSGSLTLTFNDAILDYVSSLPPVTSSAINTLSWNFSGLAPFETREIIVTLNVNSASETPAVHIGDTLSYTASFNNLNEDENLSDNSCSIKQIVRAALDPNDKTCAEGTTIASNMVGKYVHYVVNFENDGTADAQNIVVKDMIDTNKFDLSTLVPLSGSASYTTRITNTNQVEFIFQNINLPFTAGNNTGYVAFKVKTKPTLVVGNSFSNSASIFFDYNAPITTNTFTTTVATLATQDFDFGTYFSVYPIPAKDILNLEAKTGITVKSINIYDLLGQIVLAIPNAESISTIDVSNLRKGTYFIKVDTDKGTANEKFVKE